MSRSPSHVIAIGIALAALAIGVALGRWLPSSPQEPTQAATARQVEPGDSSERTRLVRELDLERGRRAALELELALLRREIAPDSEAPTEPTATAGARPDEPATAAGDEDAGTETAREVPAPEKTGRKEWFDASKLIDLGIDERHAEWLRERFESLQMEELYLRDQATRGRWIHKPRYSRELRALREETRTTIGEEDYDRLLYGGGRHNRVLLSDVLQSSPAAESGIQAGDVLVRYGDRPIYDVRDLLSETAGGEVGETASVDVLRDGELLRFFVARGPLGARIQPMTQSPAAQP